MNKKNNEYIKDQQEWQDNQYSPGHYTGGKIPVWIKHPNRKKLLIIGIVFVLMWIMYLLLMWKF